MLTLLTEIVNRKIDCRLTKLVPKTIQKHT